MTSYAQWGNELYSGKRSYNIIKHSRMFLSIGAVLMVISIGLLLFRGLNPSIEFSGGTQFIVSETADTSDETAMKVLEDNSVSESARITTLGTSSVRVQTPTLDDSVANTVRTELATAYDVSVEEVQTSSVGATWGQDVTQKALQSIVIFVVLVAAIMTIYFRSWTMSAAAMISLVHDLVITVGFFALTQVEVSPATVIGFLTILGYSLYDTVVVFDRIKEVSGSALKQDRYTFAELVNLGLNQTLVRSINTSVVALLPVASVLFVGTLLLGAGTLTDISLALFVGMFIGAWSSIFIGAPALTVMEGMKKKFKAHDQRVIQAREAKQGDDGDQVSGKEEVVVSPKSPGRRLDNSAQPKRKNRQK